MKKLCKDVDIADRGLISRAVYACLNEKYKRNDTAEYLERVSGIKREYIHCIYRRYGKAAMYPFVEVAISEIQREIVSWDISFPKIWYRERLTGRAEK